MQFVCSCSGDDGAFGRYSRTVDELDMKLARALAMKSAETLHEGVLKYTVDPQGFAALCQKIADLAAASADKFVSVHDLKRRCTTYLAGAAGLIIPCKTLISFWKIGSGVLTGFGIGAAYEMRLCEVAHATTRPQAKTSKTHSLTFNQLKLMGNVSMGFWRIGGENGGFGSTIGAAV